MGGLNHIQQIFFAQTDRAKIPVRAPIANFPWRMLGQARTHSAWAPRLCHPPMTGQSLHLQRVAFQKAQDFRYFGGQSLRPQR